MKLLQLICGLFGHKWVSYTKGQMCKRCGKKKNMDKWYYEIKKQKGDYDMTRDAEINIQTYDYAKYLLFTRFSNKETAQTAMRLAFADGAKWADAHPHWISVENELPKIGKDVLVLRKDGEMQVAHQYNEEIARWWSVDGFPLNHNITHWMPLPHTDLNKKDLPPVSCQEGDILVEEEGGEE